RAPVRQRPASALTAPSLPVFDPARRTVIMGAGPAGLTAAYALMHRQLPSVTLEQDPRFVGAATSTPGRSIPTASIMKRRASALRTHRVGICPRWRTSKNSAGPHADGGIYACPGFPDARRAS